VYLKVLLTYRRNAYGRNSSTRVNLVGFLVVCWYVSLRDGRYVIGTGVGSACERLVSLVRSNRSSFDPVTCSVLLCDPASQWVLRLILESRVPQIITGHTQRWHDVEKSLGGLGSWP